MYFSGVFKAFREFLGKMPHLEPLKKKFYSKNTPNVKKRHQKKVL